MKMISAAAIAVALVATPVLAQTNVSPSNNLKFTLDAEVGTICGVYSAQGQTIPLDFGDLAEMTSTQEATRTAELIYTCNALGGFSRTITSDNNGRLVRVGSTGGSGNEMTYRFGHSGTTANGLTVGNRGLPAAFNPVTSNHSNSTTTFLAGVRETATFQVSGSLRSHGGQGIAPTTSLFAGDYSDTVTIAVTAR
jgi:hypothetical protein